MAVVSVCAEQRAVFESDDDYAKTTQLPTERETSRIFEPSAQEAEGNL